MRFSLVRWTQSQNEPSVPVVSLIIVKRRSGALLAATLTLDLLASIFEVSLGCVEPRPKEAESHEVAWSPTVAYQVGTSICDLMASCHSSKPPRNDWTRLSPVSNPIQPHQVFSLKKKKKIICQVFSVPEVEVMINKHLHFIHSFGFWRWRRNSEYIQEHTADTHTGRLTTAFFSFMVSVTFPLRYVLGYNSGGCVAQ